MNIKNEDNTIITVLTKNFESAQKQCHELIEIIEKLTNENHHLRGESCKYPILTKLYKLFFNYKGYVNFRSGK